MTESLETIRRSRVGNRPVNIPANVTIKITGNTVNVKGPKGESSRTFHELVQITRDGDVLRVEPVVMSRNFAQFQGLSRALLRNMVQGVTEGYKIMLDLHGVGYRAVAKGQELTLSLGLSHQIVHNLRPEVKVKIEIIDEGGNKRPRLHLESHDKESVGQDAARIRSYRPPEPYKGKGVRYVGEKVREKAGKTGKGGK